MFTVSGSRALVTPPDERHSHDIFKAFLSFQRSLFTLSYFIPVMWQNCSVSWLCADHEIRPLFHLPLVCFLQAFTLLCLFTDSIWFAHGLGSKVVTKISKLLLKIKFCWLCKKGTFFSLTSIFLFHVTYICQLCRWFLFRYVKAASNIWMHDIMSGWAWLCQSVYIGWTQFYSKGQN